MDRGRSEQGFALMEVIVSAAVLILVVLGALAAFDSAAGTAGANKARTIAATLAEKDQERLRAMRTLDVDQMNLEPYSVTVAGVTYTVESKAVWVTDASDEEIGCGLGGQNEEGSYMRITSTVTSPATGAAVKPVVLSSIVAPQVGADSQGSLAVFVKNAAGQPVQGLAVRVAPSGRIEGTNALGCAIFGQLDAGNHTASLGQTGWVDRDGNPAPSQVASVTAGSLATIEFAYDVAASITVEVKDKPAGQAGRPEPAKTVLAANTGLTTGLRTWESTIVPNPNPYPTDGAVMTGSTFRLDGLFPFPSGYSFYSGSCLAADPSKLVPDYFATYGGAVVLAPGASGGVVTVYEPLLNLVLLPANRRDGAVAYAYPTGAGCGGVRIPLGTTDATGRLAYPSLPYGSYDICVWRDAGTDRRGVMGVVMDKPNGVTPAQLTLAVDSRRCGLTAPDSVP